MSETTPCPRCGGTGHAPLDPTLHDTLDALRQGTPATSGDVHRRMQAAGYRSGATAVMNQLAKLCRLGLAVRRGKAGKWHLYRLHDAAEREAVRRLGSPFTPKTTT